MDRLGYALLLVATLAGCAVFGEGPPLCHGVSRDELSARYLEEVARLSLSDACDEYADPDDCPEFQAAKARHDERRRRWVECQ